MNLTKKALKEAEDVFVTLLFKEFIKRHGTKYFNLTPRVKEPTTLTKRSFINKTKQTKQT